MGLLGIRRLIQLGLVALVALAAWLFDAHPVWAVVVVLPALAIAIFQLVDQRGRSRLLKAGLRCDLAALEKCATKGVFVVRFQASIALIHHGGFDRAPARIFCSCGLCEKDALDHELEALRQIVRLAWTGRAKEAQAQASKQELFDPKLSVFMREIVTELRLITRLVTLALSSTPDDAVDAPLFGNEFSQLTDARWPSLRWPLRLAAAAEARLRGNPEAARSYLVGMPAWPERSHLERARQELIVSLAAP